jgi:hypothetical protein
MLWMYCNQKVAGEEPSMSCPLCVSYSLACITACKRALVLAEGAELATDCPLY